ncbi:MAG: phage major capsid protein, partial [Mariprofundales bacterium]
MRTNQRMMEISSNAVDLKSRTAKLSFSSEVPIRMGRSIETLSHEAGACDLSRLNEGAPLLFNHGCDYQIGVVESATIDVDRIGRALVRFSKSSRGEEFLVDVADGIRRKASVRYEVLEEHESTKDGVESTLATKWRPLEISIVSIAADDSVGIGRSLYPKIEVKNITEGIVMVDEQADVLAQERQRVAELIALGKQYNQGEISQRGIEKGSDVFDVQSEMLEAISNKSRGDSQVGLTEKEIEKFSIRKLINTMHQPGNAIFAEGAAFELEACKAANKKSRVYTGAGQTIPSDIVTNKRILNTSTFAQAGALVDTSLEPTIIELLQNRLILANAGTTIVTGITGDYSQARQTAGASVQWMGQSITNATEGQIAFDTINMSPQRVTAFMGYTRTQLAQTSFSVEQFIVDELIKRMALALDSVPLYGA